MGTLFSHTSGWLGARLQEPDDRVLCMVQVALQPSNLDTVFLCSGWLHATSRPSPPDPQALMLCQKIIGL